jgi:hypothetical protein
VPTSQPASGDAHATAELKSTAKWLVGASASTAAVIVAGLQLTDLGRLGEAAWWFGVLALLAAFTALAAAFRILYQAASVLATNRPAISDLARRDVADHGHYPDPRLDHPDDPLLKELVIKRRTELLGPGRDYIMALTSDYDKVGKVLAGEPGITIQARSYNLADPIEVAALHVLATELERRIENVLDAAERFTTEKRYQHLKRQLTPTGIAFMAGVLAFAWLTILYPHRIPQTAPVATPVQVEVTVPSENAAMRAGLEKACAGKVLSGVDVGGTLDRPIVVTRAQAGCPAHRLGDTQDLIVVPVAPRLGDTQNLTVVPAAPPCEPNDRDRGHPRERQANLESDGCR